jgi:hypothetical protein
MAAQLASALTFGGDLFGSAGHYGEGSLVDLLAHKMIVELTDTARGVTLAEINADAPRPADVDTPCTMFPQKELEQPFGVEEICLSTWVVLRKDTRFETGNGPVRALQSKYQRHTTPGFIHFPPE